MCSENSPGLKGEDVAGFNPFGNVLSWPAIFWMSCSFFQKAQVSGGLEKSLVFAVANVGMLRIKMLDIMIIKKRFHMQPPENYIVLNLMKSVRFLR